MHHEVCNIVKNEPKSEANGATLQVKAEQKRDGIGHLAYIKDASSDEEPERVLSMLKVQLKIVLAKYLQVMKKMM